MQAATHLLTDGAFSHDRPRRATPVINFYYLYFFCALGITTGFISNPLVNPILIFNGRGLREDCGEGGAQCFEGSQLILNILIWLFLDVKLGQNHNVNIGHRFLNYYG